MTHHMGILTQTTSTLNYHKKNTIRILVSKSYIAHSTPIMIELNMLQITDL